MQTINLFASHNENSDLQTFASLFLKIIGVHKYEERFSLNYVDERYISACYMNLKFLIAMSDEKNASNLPFWIQVISKIDVEENIHCLVSQLTLDKLNSSGIHLVKVLNFGKEAETYSDF